MICLLEMNLIYHQFLNDERIEFINSKIEDIDNLNNLFEFI